MRSTVRAPGTAIACPSCYTVEQAILDGYLVDYEPVAIKSEVRMNGVFLNEGETIERVDADTGQKALDQLADERAYDAASVERDITAPDSNRKIMEEVAKYAYEHEAVTGHGASDAGAVEGAVCGRESHQSGRAAAHAARVVCVHAADLPSAGATVGDAGAFGGGWPALLRPAGRAGVSDEHQADDRGPGIGDAGRRGVSGDRGADAGAVAGERSAESDAAGSSGICCSRARGIVRRKARRTAAGTAATSTGRGNWRRRTRMDADGKARQALERW